MDPNTPEVTSEEPQSAQPEALSDRMLKSVSDKWQGAAEESPVEETPVEAEAEKPAAEEAETPAEVEAKPVADQPFTAEEIADPKHWNRLDKAGWEKAARLHPVETSLVKAAFRAASLKAIEGKREQPSPAEERADAPAKISPAIRDAVRKANSLDEEEAVEGLQDLMKLTLKDALPEFGIDPDETRAVATIKQAHRIAVEQMPELAELDIAELDAALDGDEALLALVATNDPKNVALAMRSAGRKVLESKSSAKAAEDAKKAGEKAKLVDKQKREKSNAHNVSNTIVDTPAGATPKGKETVEQYVNRQWAEVSAKA